MMASVLGVNVSRLNMIVFALGSRSRRPPG
jgi:branched-subunit amino acid ABC-type transport system permease component